MSESDAQVSPTAPDNASALQELESTPPAGNATVASSPQEPTAAPARKSSGLDLSDLKIMPAWVASFGKEPSSRYDSYDEGSGREARHSGARGDSRRGGGGGGRGSDRDRPRGSTGGAPQSRDRDRDRPFGGPRRERDAGGSGGPRGFADRDRPRRDRDGGPRPQREWVEVPKDIQVTVHPEDKSLDALTAHIRSTGQAFSLFDIARLVLAGGERFGVRFLCDEKRPQPMFHVPADGGLFLSRDEALQHVLRGPALETFYTVEEVELEEPKGNFPSVAVCGFSGEILGPASHHSFQTSLIRLHRERFSHMPLEDYKRRVRTETDPECVQKWKDQQRKARRWLPVDTAASQGDEAASGEPAATAPQALNSRHEVEMHFRRHYGDKAVVEVRDITIPGNIDKRHLSPALFIQLRQAVEGARKHLFEMSQKLSAGFDRRGLKTFKRRSGKMFICRVRPRAIDPSTVFAERVSLIVERLKQCPGGIQLNELLKELAPAPVATPSSPEPTPAPAPTADPAATEGRAESAPTTTAEPEAAPEVELSDSSTPSPTSGDSTPQQPPVAAPLSDTQRALLKDIRWLANEGYIIEYSDNLVCLGVQGETPSSTGSKEPKAPKATAPAPQVADASEPVTTGVETASEEGVSDAASPIADVAEAPSDLPPESVAPEAPPAPEDPDPSPTA